MTKRIIPIRATTQEFTEIAEINNNIVLYADGSCSLVIAVSAVNFGLLSGEEQESIIRAYAGLVNSLSFPVEILIRTQHKDISSYLNQLAEQENKQKNPKLKNSIKNYRKFISSTVKEKNVLDKKFYVVIPFSYLELGPSKSTFVGSKGKGLSKPKEQIYEKALMTLVPKRDHIMRLLSRLGLRNYQLNSQQLIKLFYSAYNPDSTPPTATDTDDSFESNTFVFVNKETNQKESNNTGQKEGLR